jgi:hypothetical protein
MRRRCARSVSEEKYWSSHLNEKKLYTTGPQGSQRLTFEQEVIEETEVHPDQRFAGKRKHSDSVISVSSCSKFFVLCDLRGLAVNYFVSVVRGGWLPKMLRCTAICELGSIGLNQG